MKRTFQVLVLAMLCVLTGNAYAQKSVKLGHFNSSELMKRMPEADSIQNVLKDYAAELDAELKAMQGEYTRLLQEYEAKQDQLTDLLKKNKENEIRSVMERMEVFQQNASLDIQNKQNELMNVLIEKIKTAVAEVAQENKYSYIFESNGILWYSEDSEDITPLLVKKMGLK
ncbi:MAG: OmpH family outer membrane protein [Bacteroidales bacterium]|nr:OmpH family outer membrane protein [Bacteroidales bacterium]